MSGTKPFDWRHTPGLSAYTALIFVFFAIRPKDTPGQPRSEDPDIDLALAESATG